MKNTMSTIRNTILTALALVPTCSMATFHQFVDTDIPVGINEVEVDALGASTLLASYITNESGEGPLLNLNVISRGTSGFSLVENRALQISNIISDVNVTRASVVSLSHDVNGYYHLISAQNCNDSGECIESEHFLINTSSNGEVNQSAPLNVDSCGNDLSLLSKEQGVGVVSSCGSVYWFDESLLLEKETMLNVYADNTYLEAKAVPWVETGEDNVDVPTPESFMLGARTGEGETDLYVTWEIDRSGNIIERAEVSLEEDYAACQLLANKQTKGTVCFNGDSFQLVPQNGDGSIFLDVYVPEDALIYAEGFWTVTANNGHVYLHYQVTSASNGELTQIVSNVDADTGARYAYHSTPTAPATTEMAIPRYMQSSDALTAVTTYVDDAGNVDVSVYADLFTVTAPYVFNVNGIQVLTGTTTSYPLTYQSENHLPGEISLSSESQANWIDVDVERKEITFTPKHTEAGIGEYMVSLSTSDTERSQNLQATAILDPLSLHVFEPVLFESAELEDSIPLTSLIEAIEDITLLEDEIRTFTFSVENREVDEYSIAINSLPEFISWSPETLELTVHPLQKDVGKTTVTISSEDVYRSEDGDGIATYDMSFNILEVDEPPLITSTPVKNIVVGQEYHYAMTFDDEETASPLLDVSLEVGPAWLSYNKEEQTLSGTPSDLYIGTSRVQVTVRDDIGNVVIHSFEITVNEVPEAEEEGGSMGAALAFLVGGMMYRRLELKKRLQRN